MTSTRVNLAPPSFTPVEIALLGAFLTIASTACGAAMAGTFLAITTIMGG